MGTTVRFIYGTEAQILAITPEDETWVERAFYYPSDRSYFYQALDGVMKKYGVEDITEVGVGATLNEKTIGAILTIIEEGDTLDIPEDYDYNTFRLTSQGVINCKGTINITS